MMNKVIINSNAKVNIGLKILKARDDGYHNIVTVFQEINLFDIISISKKSKGCDFNSNATWLINDKTNLCVIAYEAMKNKFDIDGVVIDLTKNIPKGSGLGGGSSNAACIMKGIRELYSLNISDKELEEIASQIGADVPFFIRGSIQLGEGIGDRLTPLKINISGKYLIIIPDTEIDTSWAYSKFKNDLDSSTLPINFASLSNEKTISLDKLKFFENDFESIVVPAYPEIGKIKEALHALGAGFASLSGSGSTVFGIFNDDVSLDKALSYFSPKYKTFIANPL
jgi:4-diphosphocytidyl-2-C-methyl-D-erythritol kinase